MRGEHSPWADEWCAETFLRGSNVAKEGCCRVVLYLRQTHSSSGWGKEPCESFVVCPSRKVDLALILEDLVMVGIVKPMTRNI